MRFTKETLAILKNFSTINGGIKLSKGKLLMTKSVSNAIYAEAKIEDDVELDIAIYDLNGFLNILALTGEDSDITISEDDNSFIQISKGNAKIFWPIAQDSTVVAPKKQISFPKASAVFDLSSEDYQDIMKVSRALGVDHLVIESKDGKIMINCYNKASDNKLTRPLYSQELAEYDEDAEFKYIINIFNLKLLPESYKVMLYGDGPDRMAIKFEGDFASYILSLEQGSTNNF